MTGQPGEQRLEEFPARRVMRGVVREEARGFVGIRGARPPRAEVKRELVDDFRGAREAWGRVFPMHDVDMRVGLHEAAYRLAPRPRTGSRNTFPVGEA